MCKAMAQRFAAESMRVVVADIEEPPLQATVDAITASGGDATAVVCDVSSWDSVEALRDACLAAYGPADVVCNNAGVAAAGAISDLTINSWRWCLGVNLWGVVHGVSAFLPSMIERSSGHIVNTASVLGHITAANIGAYSVSKHAVVALSETLRDEMVSVGTGVGVPCLCPGPVSTNILDSARHRPARYMDGTAGISLGAVAGAADEELRNAVRDMYAAAKAPEAVAAMVLEAVLTDQFWLFTDADFDDAIAARHRDIESRNTSSAAGLFDRIVGRSDITSS